MSAKRKIVAADFHRNGVSGVGFYVGIVREDGRNMLVVTFDDDTECYTAALDVDQAAAGNIYMHPVPDVPDSGNNAWRGDHYADLRPEFEKIISERFEKQYAAAKARRGNE